MDIILLTGEVVAVSVLRSVDFFVLAFSFNEGWVGFLEAPVFHVGLAKAFNDPVESVSGEFFIEAAAGLDTLVPGDKIVDVRHGVVFDIAAGAEKIAPSGLVVPAWASALASVFHEVPGIAPLVFFKSSRVFVEAPWFTGDVGWFVAASGVGEAFGLTDTVITAFLFEEASWQVSACSVVGGSVTGVLTFEEGFFVEAAAGASAGVALVELVIFKSFIVFHTFDSSFWGDQSAFSLILGVCVLEPHLVVVIETTAGSWDGGWVDTWELVEVW